MNTGAARPVRHPAAATFRAVSGGSIAYLVGYYPAVSHTFIHREIEALRALGLDIRTVSLRRTPPEQLLTEADREEAARTWTVLPPRPAELVAAHARAAVRRPGRYVRTLGRAMRTGGGGVRGAVWQLFYFLEAVLIFDRLSRDGVTHVHAHFANSASWIAMLVSELDGPGGMGWSFTMHGPTEFDDVTRYALAEKVASAAFVACIGDYCRAQLMKLSPPDAWDRLAVVRCGVDAGRFVPATNGDRPVRAQGDPLRVLCVGRLVPEKGQTLLVDAVALLRDRGVDAELTLVGDGPDRAALERRRDELGLGPRVRLAGAVGQDRILDEYRAADVFCLPSFAEGIPVVLMEALSCGLPVVTTNITGVFELVRDGESGFLVAPGRAEALADALERLSRDRDAAAAMGLAGRARVVDEFRLDRAAEELARRFRAASGTAA